MREQLFHEGGMRAREKNLRPPQLAPDIVDIAPYPVAQPVVLARQTLVAPQNCLRAPQIDGDVAIFSALDQATDHLTDTVAVFFVLAFALRFADLLHDHLLRRLRRDPPKIDRRQLIRDEIADLRRRVPLARLFDGNLHRLVLDLVGHFEVTHQRDRAGLAIDLRANVVFLAVFALAGVLNRLLHRIDHDVGVDPFFPRHRIGDLQNFNPACAGIHIDVHLALRPVPLRRRDQFVR